MRLRPGHAFAAALAALCCTAAVQLDAQQPEPAKTLLPGEGAALTMARCATCHDITHVTRTRLSRDEWEDNIKVMIARGMPIEPHEIAIVVDYLATYYNRDKPPPAGDAAPPAAGPASVAELLSAYGCTACHAIDKRVVGPAFQEVASKYKGQADAHALLAGKIREGGAGTWGPVPMPPNAQIGAADLDRLVAWVLRQ